MVWKIKEKLKLGYSKAKFSLKNWRELRKVSLAQKKHVRIE